MPKTTYQEVTTTLKLSAGDLVTIYAKHNQGGTQNIYADGTTSSYSWLTISKVQNR